MNKRMRELLAAIEAKTKEARGFQEAKDLEKAEGALKEIDDLQKEYDIEEKLFKTEQARVPDEPEKGADSEITKEEKAFVNFIRGTEKALSAGANGAIIPKSVANKIIETVKELCPIYAMSTIYNVKGTLSIPVYGLDEADDVQATYGTEFTDLVAHAGKFTSVDLTSLAIGALAKISDSLINNTDIDVLAFAIRKIAEAFANFLEQELLVGTGATGHMTGATKTTNTMNAGSTSAITADNLIDLQAKIKTVHQTNACWIMAPATFTGLKKLKDGNGQYLLQNNFSQDIPFAILGKPVYLSDNMPAIGSANKAVLYGDFSGMACKLAKNVEVKVLSELFAAQHATGVVGWVEADSKIENAQKFAALVMSA